MKCSDVEWTDVIYVKWFCFEVKCSEVKWVTLKSLGTKVPCNNNNDNNLFNCNWVGTRWQRFITRIQQTCSRSDTRMYFGRATWEACSDNLETGDDVLSQETKIFTSIAVRNLNISLMWSKLRFTLKLDNKVTEFPVNFFVCYRRTNLHTELRIIVTFWLIISLLEIIVCLLI